jgi:hypothetical protein
MSRGGSMRIVVVSFLIFLVCGSKRPAVSGTGGQGERPASAEAQAPSTAGSTYASAASEGTA